jgi:hypothetical protein
MSNKNVFISGIEGYILKSSVDFLQWISRDIEIQKEYLYKWKK